MNALDYKYFLYVAFSNEACYDKEDYFNLVERNCLVFNKNGTFIYGNCVSSEGLTL